MHGMPEEPRNSVSNDVQVARHSDQLDTTSAVKDAAINGSVITVSCPHYLRTATVSMLGEKMLQERSRATYRGTAGNLHQLPHDRYSLFRGDEIQQDDSGRTRTDCPLLSVMPQLQATLVAN